MSEVGYSKSDQFLAMEYAIKVCTSLRDRAKGRTYFEQKWVDEFFKYVGNNQEEVEFEEIKKPQEAISLGQGEENAQTNQ